jgi:hypothetical protein
MSNSNSTTIEITLDRNPLKALGYKDEELRQFTAFVHHSLKVEYPGLSLLINLGRFQEVRAAGMEEEAESILGQVLGSIWSEWRRNWEEVRRNAAEAERDNWSPDACEPYDMEASRGMEGDVEPGQWCDDAPPPQWEDEPAPEWDGYGMPKPVLDLVQPDIADPDEDADKPLKAPPKKKPPKRNTGPARKKGAKKP